tara:strand:+ start:145 stop:357 length:213 start_codon:yes stop_codon:yes gene_type:complete
MNKTPSYESWVIIIDKNNEYLGYTHTFKEADDICMKNLDYTWDKARILIKNKQTRLKLYSELTQLTINDF